MSLVVKVDSDIETLPGHDFASEARNGIEFLYKGFDKSNLDGLFNAYANASLTAYLDATLVPSFALIVIDRTKGVLTAINDKFGGNELYYTSRPQSFFLTDDPKRLFEILGESPKIDLRSTYELLTFHSVKPPRTIYENMFAVPMAHALTYAISDASSHLELYWQAHKRFSEKAAAYEPLVTEVRGAFEDVLRKEAGENPGISLSGGIDSGGILGALTKLMGKPVPSVTIGGWGAKTPDLESSRRTAQENGSVNEEIYPTLEDVARLPTFSEHLNQPLLADILLPNALVFERARGHGIKKLAFGFGAEMLLGNLRMSRAVYALAPFERFVPAPILRIVYRLIGFIRRFTRNQIEFLLARSLSARFLHARGALFTRERKYFKNLPSDFIQVIEKEVESEAHIGEVETLDSVVLMYLFSWVNYLQRRDMGMIAKKYDMGVIMPFDTPQVAEAMFRAPNVFRRLNRWNKQLIRDVLRPYVSDRLHAGVVRSLIVPYSVLFASCQQPLIEYLKTSSLVSELIDLESFQRDYDTLPEPGLSLMRLVGLAIWYDVTWNTKNLANFERAIDRARSITKEK